MQNVPAGPTQQIAYNFPAFAPSELGEASELVSRTCSGNAQVSMIHEMLAVSLVDFDELNSRSLPPDPAIPSRVNESSPFRINFQN
jgi:hypothetical protein